MVSAVCSLGKRGPGRALGKGLGDVVWCGVLICTPPSALWIRYPPFEVVNVHDRERVTPLRSLRNWLIIRFVIGAVRIEDTQRSTWRYLCLLVGCCPSSYPGFCATRVRLFDSG
jgi:hypothetical protein